jgi:hypothetical protein
VALPIYSRSNTYLQRDHRNRLITHLKLTGPAAKVVRDMCGSASKNALAATVVVIVGFLIWGLVLGQAYQEV